MTKKIIIGKFGKTFGLHGYLKTHSFTNPSTNILNYSPWFISKDKITWTEITEHQIKEHGEIFICKLPNISTPEQATQYVNYFIAINESQLPKITANDEYYWNDLLGCKVYNTKNILLGTIDDIFATVSNDVLVIQDESLNKQHLVPFLKNTILKVNLSQQTIVVDWDENF